MRTGFMKNYNEDIRNATTSNYEGAIDINSVLFTCVCDTERPLQALLLHIEAIGLAPLLPFLSPA